MYCFTATEPPVERKFDIRDGFPCDHCAMEFEDFEGLDSHICAVETAKLGNAEQNCHDAYNVS